MTDKKNEIDELEADLAALIEFEETKAEGSNIYCLHDEQGDDIPALMRDMGIVGASELAKAATSPEYLIKYILEQNNVGIIGGESGTFKSFLTLDIARSVASGEDFLGFKVKKTGNVLIFVGEGGGGYSRRLKALEVAKGKVSGIHVIPACPSLDGGDMQTIMFKANLQKVLNYLSPFSLFMTRLTRCSLTPTTIAVEKCLRQ